MGKPIVEIQKKFAGMGIGQLPIEAIGKAMYQAGYLSGPTTEGGIRATPENALKYLYRTMNVDMELRSVIMDIRLMDKLDGRVKKIHGRMARTAVKGGLKLKNEMNKKILNRWKEFERRLNLYRREKLESDARGLAMEGNLPLQWILTPDKRVAAGVRMPTETLVPRVSAAGVFKDPRKAYEQYDLMQNRVIASFALWQLSMVRLSPDNFDDMGSLGRPYLDASRTVWKKLQMTEEDMVIRRKTRAAQRKVHQLENPTDEFFNKYKEDIENDKWDQTTDYFIKGKGAVTAVQGDENLDQIADVVHLLDTFFAGSPAPKGLFGYSGELKRDILEDMKRDYYDEIDSMQDLQAFVYELGFRLDLLLAGINPDNYDFQVVFAERRTETANQAADRALKLQALGASKETVFEAAGIAPAKEKERLISEVKDTNPYPEPNNIGGNQRVSITPGNQRKGESATSIATKN